MSVDVLFGQAYFLRFDPEALGRAAALRAARRAVRGRRGSRPWIRGRRSSTRCSPPRSASGPMRSIGTAARGGSLRRQLQLLEQDVPAPHARSGAHHDRRRARRAASRSSWPDPTRAITLTSISIAAPSLVVVGEGEVTLVDVLDAMFERSAAPIAAIPGVCLRADDGRLVSERRARDRPRPRRAAAPGLGFGRRRAVPATVD